jgi:DNA primase
LPLINDVADPIEREHYRQLLARTLKIDERVLLNVPLPPVPGHAAPVPNQPPAATVKGQRIGRSAKTNGQNVAGSLRRANYLRQCLAYPKLLTKVNGKLALNQERMVGEDDFTRPEDKALWRLLRDKAETATESVSSVAAIEELCDSLDQAVLRRRIKDLLVLPQIPESEIDRLPDHIVSSVLDWRLEQVVGQINEMKQLLNEAKTVSEQDLISMYLNESRDLTVRKLKLDKIRGTLTNINRRLEKEKALGDK